MPTDIARAKINLTLHVGRVIKDQADPFFRYHPLDSLVVFADVADTLSCEEAEETSLSISGPYAENLEVGEDNLILKAYRAIARHTDKVPLLAFTLEKNLPVAAGIGGGSANAAATLRLMKNYVDLPEMTWSEISLKLGADVPVCLRSHTARMTGIGETVQPVEALGQLHAVLVNPGVEIMTRDIFNLFDSGNPRETPRPQKSEGNMLSRALHGRNDLEPVAIKLQAVIGDVMEALSSQAGCQLIRMSGSGATCFGLFETHEAAVMTAKRLSKDHPKWWVKVAQLGDAP